MGNRNRFVIFQNPGQCLPDNFNISLYSSFCSQVILIVFKKLRSITKETFNFSNRIQDIVKTGFYFIVHK